MSEESTVWNLPSTSVTRMSTIGFPPTTPSAIVLTMPFSTEGMNWCGTAPPKILSSYTKPATACGSGSTSIVQTAYCPWPPLCFTWRPVTFAGLRIVSR